MARCGRRGGVTFCATPTPKLRFVAAELGGSMGAGGVGTAQGETGSSGK